MFTEKEISYFHDWIKNLSKQKYTKNQYSTKEYKSEKDIWLENNKCKLSSKIVNYYNDGYGFKRISKALNISYTVCKNFISKQPDVVLRKGQNIVTDKLREIRSFNVKGEKSPWYDWPNRIPELLSKNGKSIQGYYVNINGNKVWLRSTYEYIFAKWLDERKINWKIEEKSFKLSNGENYRPDFFIYDSGFSKLESIVEIKSKYFNKGNREYKFHLFKKEYNIECSIITNIELYTNLNYHKELTNWKKYLQEKQN